MIFEALIWKYGQGILDAHIDETGKVIIDKWKHPTLPKPTKAEIQQAIEEYATHLEQENQKYLQYLREIADLDYDRVDDYINQISNLTDAKAFLKRLSKVVLGLIKVLKRTKQIE